MLGNRSAGRDFHGIGEAERSAVSLVRGVTPVALVLGLKCVTGKTNCRGNAGGEGASKCPEIEERLVRRDGAGKNGLIERAVNFFEGAGASRKFQGGMEHAKTDAIAEEGGMSNALHGKSDITIGRAKNEAVPGKIDILFLVLDSEENFERTGINFVADLSDDGRNGSPVTIADGHIDAPEDLVITQIDVAKLALFKEEGEWPGAEKGRLRRRRVRAEKNEIAGRAHTGLPGNGE